MTKVKRYNVYFTKYNIMANRYLSYVKVVYTGDIYHVIGRMLCTSIENIDSISYSEPLASEESCEKFWSENGYRKISDIDLWVKYDD